MYLESENIKLRAIEPEDLDMLYKWENDTSLWIHGNNLSPYSKLTLRQYIADSQKNDIYQSKQLRLMIDIKDSEKRNLSIGTIDLYDFDIRNSRMGVGILVDEKYRGKNYATETIQLIKEYCFKFLHIHQLYAYIRVENKISIQLFEKAGFIKNGMLKDWILIENKYQDVLIYQCLNNSNE